MSFSDEAVPAEEVAPESELVDENSDDGVADSEIELEAESDPSKSERPSASGVNDAGSLG